VRSSDGSLFVALSFLLTCLLDLLVSEILSHLPSSQMTSAEIFHRSCKTFWKTHTKVDVLIVEHKHCDVLEIVCSDSAARQQAPRIYVQKSALKSNIADDEVQYRLIMLIESIQARKQEFDRDVLLVQAWKEAMCEYIDERLELHKKFVGSKAFHMTLREPLVNEGTQSTVLCKVPASLVCFDLPGFALPRYVQQSAFICKVFPLN